MQKINKFEKASSCTCAMLLALVLGACGVGGKDELSGGNSTQDPGPPPTAAGAGNGLGQGRGPAPLNLGASANYAILSVNALTNLPSSQVTGNIGLTKQPGSHIQLSCAEVNGTIFTSDNSGPPCRQVNGAGLLADELDADAAYNDAITRTPDYSELADGNIGGLNLGPATYYWSTGVTIGSNLTLTGGPEDVWIFNIKEGLEVAPDVQIILKGGALPKNIFWAPTFTVDVGANSRFSGILLPAAPVIMGTGASIRGALLAYEVHLDQNVVGP